MRNIYLIATAAARCPEAEQPLWDYLGKVGFVRPLYDPVFGSTISSHQIAYAEPKLAEIARNRLKDAGLFVVLISMITSPAVLIERVKDRRKKQIESEEMFYQKQFELSQKIKADYPVPSDDLDIAAELIEKYIELRELLAAD